MLIFHFDFLNENTINGRYTDPSSVQFVQCGRGCRIQLSLIMIMDAILKLLLLKVHSVVAGDKG